MTHLEPVSAFGVLLESVPLVPYASDVFTRDELEARIANYAAKYANAPRCGCVCWCCGKATTRTAGFHLIGWVARVVNSYSGSTMREVYCRECFAEWGWPEEIT